MAENKELSYEEYQTAAKKLLKMLFGEELYNQLENAPFKAIKWKGPEIHVSELLAGGLTIKETFDKDGKEYAEEQGRSMLEMYILSIFHYGYQQAILSLRPGYEREVKLYQKMLELAK